ncbi:MAG TPA: UTP--glucose-1-phosphate uridylyltransferase GalU [Dehalococcoidia bacterium]|jgi:UTP--glucose-1-phosphate uridylyltransferase|nr:UTP--glucose-1-phosphate uridylyltransferase GalU [Dehalococcoidia bacterium]
MKVRKAVITAAGWGTRFLPATKAQPKEMLPLVNKPIIQYAVEEAATSGIEQIVIVTAMGKHSVEDHFDRCFELEYVLQQKGMTEALAEISAIGNSSRIYYVRQREQLGLGHAVLTARDFIGEEPFALLLPDDVILSQVPVTRQLIEVFEQHPGCVLAVEEVPEEKISSYGIIRPRQLDERLCQVFGLVEKPDMHQAPSNLGIVGRYVLTPDIFAVLEETLPGKGGEIQLTDGLNALLERQNVFGYRFEGRRYDTGTPLGLLKASIAVALENPEMAEELKEYLVELMTSKRQVRGGVPAREEKAQC